MRLNPANAWRFWVLARARPFASRTAKKCQVCRRGNKLLGKLERVKPIDELLEQLTHNVSSHRTIAAYAIAQKNLSIEATLEALNKLKQDKRPWVRLGAWKAYELLEERHKAEKDASRLIHQADSLFRIRKFLFAGKKYQSAFWRKPEVTQEDSVLSALAKFKQACCAVLLKRKSAALEALKTAFEYNPTLRDTLQ
jgi:hypothetical protein